MNLQMAPLFQSMQQSSQEYRQMVESDTATDAQLRDKHRQIQAISQQSNDAGFERQLAIRNVLTADQRKQRVAIMRDPAKMREIFQQLYPSRKPTPSMMTPRS